MPVERCFDWESLTLVELAVGNTEAADTYAAPRRRASGATRAATPDGAGRSGARGGAARGR